MNRRELFFICVGFLSTFLIKSPQNYGLSFLELVQFPTSINTYFYDYQNKKRLKEVIRRGLIYVNDEVVGFYHHGVNYFVGISRTELMQKYGKEYYI